MYWSIPRLKPRQHRNLPRLRLFVELFGAENERQAEDGRDVQGLPYQLDIGGLEPINCCRPS